MTRTSLVERALTSRRVGPYTLQAAIAAVHGEAAAAEATDWAQIVARYDFLLQIGPSPVIRLNRAVAVAMRDGPAAGLALIQGRNKQGELAGCGSTPRRPTCTGVSDRRLRPRQPIEKNPEYEPTRTAAALFRTAAPGARKKIVWTCVEFGGRQTTKGAGPK